MYIFVYIFVSYNLRSTRVKPTGFQTLSPSKFKGWYPPQGGRAFHFGKAWHDVAGSVRFNTKKQTPKFNRRYPEDIQRCCMEVLYLQMPEPYVMYSMIMMMMMPRVRARMTVRLWQNDNTWPILYAVDDGDKGEWFHRLVQDGIQIT